MLKIVSTTLLSLLLLSTAVANSEKLFYLTPDIADSYFSTDKLQQIKTHAKSIDILGPQIYTLDKNGLI